jgi:RNA recognition motif-containing protein
MSIEDAERAERDDRTIFISGITEKVTDKLLYELFFQAGKVFNCLLL